MLVGEDHFKEIRGNGDFVISEVLWPLTMAQEGIHQCGENVPQRNSHCFPLVFRRPQCDSRFAVRPAINSQLCHIVLPTKRDRAENRSLFIDIDVLSVGALLQRLPVALTLVLIGISHPESLMESAKFTRKMLLVQASCT